MGHRSITVNVEEDRAVVALEGEHEAYTADKLARQLRALLDEGVGVTIDLGAATFIDSTVVGVLIAAQRRARAHGLEFALRLGEQTGWSVRRLLEITSSAAQFEVAGP